MTRWAAARRALDLHDGMMLLCDALVQVVSMILSPYYD